MKKLLLFALIPILLFCGCDYGGSDTGSTPTSIDSRGIYPNFTVLGAEVTMRSVYYVIDNTTEVVYIAFGTVGRRGAGITVALNADGTPVTKEQLYKNNYVKEEEG